jgi:hypothetical protein
MLPHPSRAGSAARVVQAAKLGDVAQLRRLLAAGADADGADLDAISSSSAAQQRVGEAEQPPTPLGLAAWHGHTAAVRLLLAAAADIELPTAQGATPLQLAAGGGRAETVELLLAAGADPNSRCPRGPALLLCAEEGAADGPAASVPEGERVEVARLLLAAKAEVDACRVSGGLTALQASTRLRRAALAEVLLDAGATPVFRALTTNVEMAAARARAGDEVEAATRQHTRNASTSTSGGAPPDPSHGLEHSTDGLKRALALPAGAAPGDQAAMPVHEPPAQLTCALPVMTVPPPCANQDDLASSSGGSHRRRRRRSELEPSDGPEPWLLLEAIVRGDLAEVRRLLRAGVDPNCALGPEEARALGVSAELQRACDDAAALPDTALALPVIPSHPDDADHDADDDGAATALWLVVYRGASASVLQALLESGAVRGAHLALLLACTRCWEPPTPPPSRPPPIIQRRGASEVALELAGQLVSERVPGLGSWVVFRDSRSGMPFTLRDLAVYRRGPPSAPRPAVVALIELLERAAHSGGAWLAVRRLLACLPACLPAWLAG